MTSPVAVADLSNVVMSLALVLTFIFGAAFVLRRTSFGGIARRNDHLKVLAALPLGPKERLLLIRARERELLIAVSPAGVFTIGDTAPGAAQTDLPAAAEQQPAPAFMLGDHS